MAETFEPEAARDGTVLYQRSYAAEAKRLCTQGASEADLAKHFEVSLAQVQLWCACHEEFRHAVMVGGAVADQRVAMALYRRATGYDVEEPRTIVKKDGTTATVIDKKHVPPDPGAAQYWLENRQPEAWRSRTEVNHNINKADVRELTDDELVAIIRAEERNSARGEPRAAEAPRRPSKLN